jgi:glycosyltransferase involved in cell wall biosynthesis
MLPISVIVPTHNRALLLRDALVSLARQEYPADCYEVIVVDNGSVDKTKEFVAEVSENFPEVSVQYLFEPRKGLIYARHTGARSARFATLAFTDDDALLCPEWLSGIAAAFDHDDRVAAVAGPVQILWDSEPPAWVLAYEPLLGKLSYGSAAFVRQGVYINGGNFSINKSVLEDLGGFNPDQVGDWLIGDGETGLCHKLFASGAWIGYAPNALMEHRQFVRKNATVKDMKRRFANNGVGVPYRIFVVDNKGIKGLLKHLPVSLFHLLIASAAWTAFVFLKRSERRRAALFQISYAYAQIPYIFRILASPSFRIEVRKDYWSM